MPPTVPLIMVEEAPIISLAMVEEAHRRLSLDYAFFDISVVRAESVPVQFRFDITKNRPTLEGMGTAVFPLRCEPCHPNIPSFWDRLDDYLV